MKTCHSLLTQSPHPELPRANGLNKNVLKKILANFITKETENPYICIQHVYYNYLFTVSKPNYWKKEKQWFLLVFINFKRAYFRLVRNNYNWYVLFNLVFSNSKERLYYFYKIWESEVYLLSQDINVIPNFKSFLKKRIWNQFTVLRNGYLRRSH